MLERRAERGAPTPAFDSQPELYADVVPVWECFWRLNVARGRGPSGLPLMLTVADVSAALEIADVPREDRDEWLRLLQSMDLTWMTDVSAKWTREKEKEVQKAGKESKRANSQSQHRRQRGNRRRG